jgi:hypothetical protein
MFFPFRRYKIASSRSLHHKHDLCYCSMVLHDGDEFEIHWQRLQTLQRWYELAVRPSVQDCLADDLDLLTLEVDDCEGLRRRCITAREQLNQHLRPAEITEYTDCLVARTSSIPSAGLGLFYESNDEKSAIPAGATLCYYTGHIHNIHSSRELHDTSYLMLIDGDLLVDAGPIQSIYARFINDPLNDAFVNCKFVPQPTKFRSAVVSTRQIFCGDELFAEYGDGYWASQRITGRAMK